MILAALLLASAAAPSACAGYYALIPKDDRAGVPFSVQIAGGKARLVAMDYERFETPARVDDHGAVNFVNPANQARYQLTCDAGGANIVISYPDSGAPDRYRLVRTRTDIFGVAKARHWPIGD